jgi:hypothetical protein
MLDRVEMNLMNVPLKVGVIADHMLAKPALPQPALAFGDFARRAGWTDGQVARETPLDQAPAHRKIAVIWRKPPNRVEVVRQDANRDDRLKSPALLHGNINVTQMVDVTNQHVARPVGKRDREEERSTLDGRTPVTRHTRAGRVGHGGTPVRASIAARWPPAHPTAGFCCRLSY